MQRKGHLKLQGLQKGASYVTEHNPKTGQVRSWNECYDQQGQVNRVHPKTIDGQTVQSNHYPLTQKEIEVLSIRSGEFK